MSTAFYHRHDHAVIVFADTLQWTPALELVDTLDTLVELYFYALVELVVSSPGGDVRALHYVLDAMQAHRAQGLRIRTRVLSHAESAGACIRSPRTSRPRSASNPPRAHRTIQPCSDDDVGTQQAHGAPPSPARCAQDARAHGGLSRRRPAHRDPPLRTLLAAVSGRAGLRAR